MKKEERLKLELRQLETASLRLFNACWREEFSKRPAKFLPLRMIEELQLDFNDLSHGFNAAECCRALPAGIRHTGRLATNKFLAGGKAGRLRSALQAAIVDWADQCDVNRARRVLAQMDEMLDKFGEDIGGIARGAKEAGMEEQTQQLLAFLNDARAKASGQVARIREWLAGVHQGENICQKGYRDVPC